MFLIALLLVMVGCSATPADHGLEQELAGAVTEDAAASNDYTFVWMTDTQVYSESYPEIYAAMTRWIVDHAESQNIRFVFHTGDLVNQNVPVQWKKADAAMHTLDGCVPYSVLAGNHDLSGAAMDYTSFLSYFGSQRFSDATDLLWFENGQARGQILDTGTRQLLVLALGFSPSQEMVEWADQVLSDYAALPAILTTHDYLNTDGTRSETGERLFQALVEKHSNVHMVLCGHNHDAAKNISEMDDNQDGITDRVVYQLLADYQETPNGGNGYMRLLTVREDQKMMYVQTYSPYLDDYDYFSPDEYPEKDAFSFSIQDWFE